MKTRTAISIIIAIVLAIFVIWFICSKAVGQEVQDRLHSREQAKRIMAECWEDADGIEDGAKSYTVTAQAVSRLAVAMFYYRTGMIPIIED